MKKQGMGGGIKSTSVWNYVLFKMLAKRRYKPPVCTTLQWGTNQAVGMPEYWSLIMSAFNKAQVHTHTYSHDGHAHTDGQFMYVWSYINWSIMWAKQWQQPACLQPLTCQRAWKPSEAQAHCFNNENKNGFKVISFSHFPYLTLELSEWKHLAKEKRKQQTWSNQSHI